MHRILKQILKISAMYDRKRNSHFKYEIGKMVPKKSYESEKLALRAARFLNTKENIIHKMVAYKCETCGKWHVGRNNTELTDEDRKYYKQLLEREKKMGF